MFFLAAVGLLPWVVWLAVTLPRQAQARHYRLAWVGFDVGMLALLAAVAWLARRRSPRVELAAASAATYLLIDVWFDVVTAASDRELWQAAIAAALLELPLAAVCGWTAAHAEEIRREGIRRLWLRSYRPRRASRLRRRAARLLGAPRPPLIGDLASKALSDVAAGRVAAPGPAGTAGLAAWADPADSASPGDPAGLAALAEPANPMDPAGPVRSAGPADPDEPARPPR